MNYFLKKKKWLAWVIMLTFLFTSFMPSNIMAGNSVAEAAEDSITILKGESTSIGNYWSNRTWAITEGKDVVSLSSASGKSVKVTGEKAGMAIVEATGHYSKDTYTITVTDNGGSSELTPQNVYVYVKVGGNTDGLTLNSQGWYTIGVIQADLPNAEAEYNDKNYGSGSYEYGKPHIGKVAVKDNLEKINRYRDNLTIATELLYNNSVNWYKDGFGLNISAGATNYHGVEDGYYWHLDGYLEIDYKYVVNHHFYDENGNLVRDKQVQELVLYKDNDIGNTITADSKQKSFAGYTYDSALSDPKDITLDGGQNEVLNLYYKPNTNTKYTVNHYQQNLDGSYPDQPTDVENKKGTTETVANYTAKSYPGFTLNNALSSYQKADMDSADLIGNQTITIAGDGSLVINLYYDRKVLDDVTLQKVDDDNKPLAGAEFTFDEDLLDKVFFSDYQFKLPNDLIYGQTYTVKETTTPAGYTGVGHFDLKVDTDANGELILSSSNGNVTYNSEEKMVTVKNIINQYSLTVQHIYQGGPLNGTMDTEGPTAITYNSTVEKDAKNTSGYVLKADQTAVDYVVDDVTQTLVIKDNGSKVTGTMPASNAIIKFYYGPRTDLSYTVNYLEKGTNEVLAPQLKVDNQTFGSAITSAEKVIEIDGYNYDSVDKETLAIGTGENVINVYYTARTDLSYTVNYLEKGTNEVLAPQLKVDNQTFGSVITSAEKVIEIDGYNYDSVDKETLAIGTGENVINVYYTARTDLSYTVNYLEKGTNEVLAPQLKVDNQTFGSVITSAEKVIEIDGYNYDSVDKETLAIGTGENVINVYYTARTDLSYTVNYLEKGTNEVLASTN